MVLCVEFVVSLCVECVGTLCGEFVEPLCVEVVIVSLEDGGKVMDWQYPLTITETSSWGKVCKIVKKIDTSRVNQIELIIFR